MRCYKDGLTLLSDPALVSVAPGLYALRFELLKAACAHRAVTELLRAGTIHPGATVIDSSSGLYALALGLACRRENVQCYIVGSTSIDPCIAAQLRLLGVALETMPPTDSLSQDQNRRVARIHDLLAEHPGWHWMQQYHSVVHALGYEKIGSDLAETLGSSHSSLSLVCPVGTGASSAGLYSGLSCGDLEITMVAVEPFGSVSFGSEHIADPAMLIAGIGSSIAFGNIRHDIFDAVHWVSSEVAASGCSNLLQHTGLFVGLSSGAAYVAAEYEHAAGSPRADHATVFLCPDTGHRYVESIMGHNCVSSSPHVALPRPHLLDRASARPKIALPWSRCSLR